MPISFYSKSEMICLRCMCECHPGHVSGVDIDLSHNDEGQHHNDNIGRLERNPNHLQNRINGINNATGTECDSL